MEDNPSFYRRPQNLKEGGMLHLVREVVGFPLPRLAPILSQGTDVHNQVGVWTSAAFDSVLSNT